MSAEKRYEIACRECNFRRLVSQADVHRAIEHVSQDGHKLLVDTVDD